MSEDALLQDIKSELLATAQLLRTFINKPENLKQIDAAARLMASSIAEGGKIIACGNGGSHCDAMHFAEELTGRYRMNRRPLPAMAISDPAHLSCVSNDFSFGEVFSRYVDGLGKPGDVLLGISSSGNSKNIVAAVATARERGMRVVLLLGGDGGLLKGQGDVSIVVSHRGFADRIQEIHIKVIHVLIYCLEKLL